MIPDYYAVLGVPENATEAEIRTAYRRLVRRYHPDVNKAAGSEDHIKEINLAYESLSDPVRRKHYDPAIQVLRDEQARIAYEERMRSAAPPPPPASPPYPTPAPRPEPSVPSQPPYQHATVQARPAGMRSGKVVLATVLLVVLAMVVATRFDVPAKGEATFVPSDQMPHGIPTSTATAAVLSLILPNIAPTVAPLNGSVTDTRSGAGPDGPQPTGPINLATYMADLQATTSAFLTALPSPTPRSLSDVATLTSGLHYRTPTPENRSP